MRAVASASVVPGHSTSLRRRSATLISPRRISGLCCPLCSLQRRKQERSVSVAVLVCRSCLANHVTFAVTSSARTAATRSCFIRVMTRNVFDIDTLSFVRVCEDCYIQLNRAQNPSTDDDCYCSHQSLLQKCLLFLLLTSSIFDTVAAVAPSLQESSILLRSSSFSPMDALRASMLPPDIDVPMEDPHSEDYHHLIAVTTVKEIERQTQFASLPPSLPSITHVIRAGLFGLYKEGNVMPKCVAVFLCDNLVLIGSISLRRFTNGN